MFRNYIILEIQIRILSKSIFRIQISGFFFFISRDWKERATNSGYTAYTVVSTRLPAYTVIAVLEKRSYDVYDSILYTRTWTRHRDIDAGRHDFSVYADSALQWWEDIVLFPPARRTVRSAHYRYEGRYTRSIQWIKTKRSDVPIVGRTRVPRHARRRPMSAGSSVFFYAPSSLRATSPQRPHRSSYCRTGLHSVVPSHVLWHARRCRV